MKREDAATVELHIEELVLHGFENPDRAQLEAALREALDLLFQERGVPSTLSGDGQVGGLDGGTFTMQPDVDVQIIGDRIARSLYRSFGP